MVSIEEEKSWNSSHLKVYRLLGVRAPESDNECM